MAKRMTKKERAEYARLGAAMAERACVHDEDNDAIEWPEEMAIHYYPYKSTTGLGCPYFAVYRSAFVQWVRNAYDLAKQEVADELRFESNT